MISPNSAANEYLATLGGIPKMELPTGHTIERPHRSWLLHQLRWRWLLDSYEGGEAYRLAVYGLNVRGLPVRNLIRHKREYPTSFDASWSLTSGRPAGTDMANQDTDDDYELRRARTPIPSFVADTVNRHLGEIYTREIKRESTDDRLTAFWEDIDGERTSIDTWMSTTVAQLLLVLGQLDILIEPPSIPQGDLVESRADEIRLGLDTCVASHILPENLPWWKLTRRGQYSECVVREAADDGTVKYRYWNTELWQEYHADGKAARTGPIEYGQMRDSYGPVAGGPVYHGYGRVPIIRLFDRRRPRERHCGLPRYERIAEIQREYYNRSSELILSDTTHAHPLLQGPEEYVVADGTIPIGPNWLLPKKKSANGDHYEGFDAIVFPTAGAESLRLNLADLRDDADRSAMLMKPAGAQGTDGGTVGQSGIAKTLDAGEGHKLLSAIAEILRRAEVRIAELALTILDHGKPPKVEDIVRITYPKKYCLLSSDQLLLGITQYQAALATAGQTPQIDHQMLCEVVRLLVPGLDDEQYAAFDEELEEYLERQTKDLEQARENPPPTPPMLQLTGPSSVGDGGSGLGEPLEEDASATESTERESPDNQVGTHTQ